MHKLPAFLDHRHSAEGFQPLSADHIRFLQRLLNLGEVELEVLPSSYAFPMGFFRAKPVEQKNWRDFYKVLPAAAFELEKHSANFEEVLSQAGLCSRQMSVYRQQDYCICHLPYLDLLPLELNVQTAKALGQHLARVHNCLEEQLSRSERETVRQQWQERLISFEECWREFSDQSLSEMWGLINCRADYGAEPSKFVAEFEQRLQLLHFDLAQAQVVHGDLNPGNVLLAGENRSPLLIDFENSHYSYLPRIMDVGMLIHRVFLPLREKGTKGWDSSVAAFFQAYGKPDSTMSLAEAMIACCVRSQCVLIERYVASGHWLQSEWQKFEHLIQQVETDVDSLNRLMR
ncbi:aminoglycoside phosphotransferase family protein [Thiomicrorhabdus sp. 6S3-12]|uniref:phosphotransferase n=1 Tax=Thiomicrorhabdus sp. 6S3-12 TaxID=2819681 RepID=UPI001AACCD11|nr:aminoglycoside phosphotransferase family protein [Thiomicrorhabdus sp. 6S3-12]MBO1924514.1 aminoglycoside phosphotransferase family protein [Thiomicrorhabdus sp. 6S3-12]